MDGDIKKFFLRFALFTPVLLVFVIFPTVILFQAGEMVRLDDVIGQQVDLSRVVLFGKAYNGKGGYYCLNAVLKRRPDVISLGSSRVMALRSKFFKPGIKFYNAGGGAAYIRHYREFLSRLPVDTTPKVLIVQLDQTYFNASWVVSPEMLDMDKLYSDADLGSLWMTALQKVGNDYRQGKYRLRDIFARQQSDFKKIGLSAIAKDEGTLNDGSHYYGGYIRNPQDDPDYGFRLSLQKISDGSEFFHYGDKVSQEALQELDIFLQECRRRKIHVVGFLAPFAHTVYKSMLASGKYAYLDHLGDRVGEVFARLGYSFFDFTDLASVGASDDEIYDGYHGSEKAYLRLFLKMIEKDPVLMSMTDNIYLQKRLSQSDNPYVVFSAHEF